MNGLSSGLLDTNKSATPYLVWILYFLGTSVSLGNYQEKICTRCGEYLNDNALSFLLRFSPGVQHKQSHG